MLHDKFDTQSHWLRLNDFLRYVILSTDIADKPTISLKSRQNGRQFADDIIISLSVKFVP